MYLSRVVSSSNEATLAMDRRGSPGRRLLFDRPRRPKYRRFATQMANPHVSIRQRVHSSETVARLIYIILHRRRLRSRCCGVAEARRRRERSSTTDRRAQVRRHRLRPEIRRDYPLNLSILISGGKETNQDSLSNGE